MLKSLRGGWVLIIPFDEPGALLDLPFDESGTVLAMPFDEPGALLDILVPFEDVLIDIIPFDAPGESVVGDWLGACGSFFVRLSILSIKSRPTSVLPFSSCKGNISVFVATAADI